MKNNRKPRFMSAEEAAGQISSFDRVVLGNFCAEPYIIPEKIMERAHSLDGVKFFHCTPFGNFQEKYLIPGMEKHIQCVTPFSGRKKGPRHAISKGKGIFVPLSLSRMPSFLTEKYDANVLITMVSPPNKDGLLSLGVSVDFARALLEKPVEKLIVEINPNMPVTMGDSFFHISQVDIAVETDSPLFEFEQKKPSEIENRIGKYVASLVEDGATVQIGFGNVSEATVVHLMDKKDIGIHSEMIPDGIIDLANAGILTGKRKSINKEKIVCTFIGGTKKIYEWINKNNAISIQRAEYVNDPITIAKNYKMTAINSALQVDLYGNIYSDIFGLSDQYTGSGGQLDFAIGCSLRKDSKFIIALPSTALNGALSRIVAHPSLEGNPNIPIIPTVPRYLADYVVTEFGIAALKYRGNLERANALIKIAHPQFRDDLIKKAMQIGLC